MIWRDVMVSVMSSSCGSLYLEDLFHGRKHLQNNFDIVSSLIN